MFKIITRDKTRFHFKSHEESKIIPVMLFNRAKERNNQQSIIRKPLEVVINNGMFIFTRNEWEKYQMLADEHRRFNADIYKSYKMNRENAIQKAPTQMKHRPLSVRHEEE